MFPRTTACLCIAVLLGACAAPGPSASPTVGPTASVTPTPTMQPTPSPQPTPSARPTASAPPTATTVPTLPPRPTPQPSRTSQPTPSPSPLPSDAPLTLTVLPANEPVEARPAIPGERVSFLVLVDDRNAGDGTITFKASGSGLTVDSLPTGMPPAGQPSELWVTIGPVTEITTAWLELTATHAGDPPFRWSETRAIIVTPGQDDRAAEAQPYFDRWIDWLAANHPELGITRDTEWQSMYVSPLWIVSKYAYWSEQWEMVVAWHIMVAPDDFTEVYLRQRSDQTTYSLAFRQDSFSANSLPRSIEPGELIR
jgi:hypothetical protein